MEEQKKKKTNKKASVTIMGKATSEISNIIKEIVKQQTGITLIALVISIIVMLILAGVSLDMTVGENGIITKAQRANITSELANYQEEFETYKASKVMEDGGFLEESLTAGKENLYYNTQKEGETGNIKTIIPDISDVYLEQLEIIKGKLLLNTQDTVLIGIAKTLGIEVNPYDIVDGVLLSSVHNLDLMDEEGTLTLPDSITSIGAGAFSNVKGLKTIIIPGTCKEILASAFAYNETLEKVIIQNGVEKIGARAFLMCTKLKSVQLPDSINDIGTYAFYYCANLSEINIPNALIQINDGVLQYTSITSISLPEKIKSIGNDSFANCSKLTTINIPKSVETISVNAFEYDKALKNIDVSEENVNFEFKAGILLGNNKTEMILILESALSGNVFTVPDGVTILNGNLLSDYSQIDTVKVPKSVTTINYVFFINNTIINVIIDSENPSFKSDGEGIYSKDGTRLIKYYANKSKVTLEEGLTVIGIDAFRNQTNVVQIEFPETLQTITDYAFYGCSNLTSIALGARVSSINNNAIHDSAIENISIDDENPNYAIKNGALYNKDGTVFISPVKKLGNITTYEIPEGVEEIKSYAFNNQSNMTEIKLPSTLKIIGSCAFMNCSSFEKIDIPASVTTIGSNVFTNCKSLETITIHKEKNSIGGSPWGSPLGERAIIWKP